MTTCVILSTVSLSLPPSAFRSRFLSPITPLEQAGSRVTLGFLSSQYLHEDGDVIYYVEIERGFVGEGLPTVPTGTQHSKVGARVYHFT